MVLQCCAFLAGINSFVTKPHASNSTHCDGRFCNRFSQRPNVVDAYQRIDCTDRATKQGQALAKPLPETLS